MKREEIENTANMLRDRIGDFADRHGMLVQAKLPPHSDRRDQSPEERLGYYLWMLDQIPNFLGKSSPNICAAKDYLSKVQGALFEAGVCCNNLSLGIPTPRILRGQIAA